ncbi:Cof-type HAD-IIB family hydrolase [uncultured Ilyobacter sp.]|uniref:Cof-type HAD-IIB family hydrolase n=1 Tax=uncultured Ilyobacter sp. TaxID=544433 RepID=UPI0029C7B05C|nr:Cof-type HAD-IIB family hydrolase [uncultured Ilyobacter sp.]
METQNKIRLVAIDLDGTLLNSHHEVSLKNAEVLRKLEKAGIQVVITTGRAYEAMTKFYREIGLSGEVICYNGSVVYDKEHNIVWKNILDHETGLELVKIGEKYGIYHHGFIDNKWVVPEMSDMAVKYKERTGLTETLVDFHHLEDVAFTKMMYIGENEMLMDIYNVLDDKFGDQLYKAFSNPMFLEIMHRNSSKANALSYLLEQKGLTTENLLAIGDGYNDFEMLSMAGIGVVMENAPMELKKHFTYKALSNDEDGVGKFLENFFGV